MSSRLLGFLIVQLWTISTLADEPFRIPANIETVLKTTCLDCHSGDDAEGDVRLDSLAKVGLDGRLGLLNRVQEQLFLEQMPPEGGKFAKPTERSLLVNWISSELKKYDASMLEKKLKKPEFGNYIDHEKLFSGEFRDQPGFTYDRRWLISEYIFNAKFQRILQVNSKARRDGRNVSVLGSHKINRLSLTNPFLLPTNSGVRYYANTDLTGSHISSMLTNAQKSSEYITEYLVKRNKKYLPAISEILALEDQHADTLLSRREFLEKYIARVCEESYGDRNAELLPQFVPAQLNEKKKFSAEDTKKDKPLPLPVARNILDKSGGWHTFQQVVLDPANCDKTDAEIVEICERIWFFYGDFERDIQSRLSMLRDYASGFREMVANDKRAKRDMYKPLEDSEMLAITAAITKHRAKGDHYNEVIKKCMTDWEQEFSQERVEAGPPADQLLNDLVDQLSLLILERRPDAIEAEDYVSLAKTYIDKLGKRKAIQKLIQTFMLSGEFAYRQEFGTGEPDEHDRRMLSPRDASYAIAYALTDQSPDSQLVQAAAEGKLNTRGDYEREVKRLLQQRDRIYIIDPILADKNYRDNTTNMPIRKLRFFREFFGYPAALTIFKDEKRFGGDRLGNATARLINETDRLIEHILNEDTNVFEELLTTEKFYVYHDGNNDSMQAASDRIKSIYNRFKELDWENFKKEDLLDHREFLKEVKMRSVDPDKLDARNRQGNTIQLFKKSMRTITARLDKGQKEAAPYDLYRGYGNDFMPGYNVAKFYNFSLDDWDYQTVQPAKVPHRKGILTSPAWLIAHSQNTETDPVKRGKFVREKLLAGTIPDVPITVDASIPEDHHKTLRQRLASATENDYCWKCHIRMNPIGNAFEIYDDFGRYRKQEPLEYPDQLVESVELKRNESVLLTDTRDIYNTLPVDAVGHLEGTGDEKLDGNVTDAMDLAERLAKSRRVRQSIIRHAFRYFMGRNETLSDSGTLMDAEEAYMNNSGSFDAVIVSLLTSDSFIYRKPIEE